MGQISCRRRTNSGCRLTGGGLGCVRGGVSRYRGGSGAANLYQGALPPAQRLWQPPVPAAATDPPCRQRQCHAWGDAGITAGGDGRAEILLEAKGLQRQPLLGIPVPNGQIPSRLPKPAIRQAKTRPASGWRLLWIGTTTGTATAASNSSRPINAIAVPPQQSAGSEPMSRRRPARPIQDAGADPLAAGANQKKCGSTSHQRSPIRSTRYP